MTGGCSCCDNRLPHTPNFSLLPPPLCVTLSRCLRPASTLHAAHRGLDHIRREAEGLLERLEEHYYTSAHKGPLLQPPQPDPAAATLAELCAQAQAMIDDMHVQ